MWESIIALVLGISAVGYLVVALFNPERFS
ncbi:K(+)-transporting ATPase subunit F [Arcanobacterium ihumii]|nr:K(+)-transporting ATPase subunit F [Arcanobacterium ihumii]